MRAWQRDSGEVLWSSENFRFRGLGAPAAWGQSMVFGDADGFVHMVGLRDGSLLNRLATDGSAVALAPLVVGTNLVLVTQRGAVYALTYD